MTLIRMLTFASVLLLAESSEAATFNGLNLLTSAVDTSVSSSCCFQNYSGTTIPPNSTLNATGGGSYAKNNYSWTVSGGQTVFSLDMDYQRSGSLNSYARIYSDSVNFKANSDGPYTLSGYFNVTDVGAAGYVYMRVQLVDFILSYPFYSEQISKSTPNEQFILGGAGGDFSNFSQGSLTGNLTAGRMYEIRFDVITQAKPDEDAGATALGNITLTMGTVAIPGDFNNNGSVDAGDYVVWRHNNGPTADYSLWRSHYSQPITGSGSSIESASVPEPSSLLPLGISAISLLGYRGTKSQI